MSREMSCFSLMIAPVKAWGDSTGIIFRIIVTSIGESIDYPSPITDDGIQSSLSKSIYPSYLHWEAKEDYSLISLYHIESSG